MSKKAGYVIGDTKSATVEAITSEPFTVGEYVTIKSTHGTMLGMVEESTVHSMLLSDVTNFDDASTLVPLSHTNRRDKKFTARISVVGMLDTILRGHSEIPTVPPIPGDVIESADPKDLGQIFAPARDSWAQIGTLLRNGNIPVKVDIDRIASRHLGILAMTGMGKSNTVALLTREIVARSGTAIIFDYHDDYTTLAMDHTNILDAKVNPRILGPDELADMLDFRVNADKQRSLLEKSLTRQVRKDGDFWGALTESIRTTGEIEKNKTTSLRVIEKVESARRRLGDMLDPSVSDPMALIKVGHANVLNTSEFGERQANAALSYYLREILNDRKDSTVSRRHGRPSKSRFSAPVFVVIEEAHAFIPKDRDTGAKYWASRIAREGRKFGVGLCIVSQRPRGIDIDILSQMGSFAAMRMIQSDDQRQIKSAAESAGQALVDQLGTLNVGEAVLTGQWTSLDAIVKIDEAREKAAGSDQSAVSEWAADSKKRSAGIERTGDMIQRDLLLKR